MVQIKQQLASYTKTETESTTLLVRCRASVGRAYVRSVACMVRSEAESVAQQSIWTL